MKNGRLAPFRAELEAIARDARAEFGALNETQLNWKPAPERWSVAQCLEHLILIDGGYAPIVEQIENGTYRTPLAGRIPGLPRLFGKLVLNGVQPEQKRRVSTSKAFVPVQGNIRADIVERFERHIRELAEHVPKLDARNAADVVVPSPIASFITYSLYDAHRIVVAHARRHMLQAKRVTQEPGFPTH